jgi:two-component system OmpR family response regulator
MDTATVLIVDDNRPLARAVAELLSRRQFRTLVAGTAGMALSLARCLRPHLVIADMELPDQSGAELAERLAACVPRIPVILMSAADGALGAGRLAESVFATLQKPFDPLSLVALVRRALREVGRISLEFPLVLAPRRLPVRSVPRPLKALTRLRVRNWEGSR